MPETQTERTLPVDPAAQAALIRTVMGRQAALSLRVAAVFLVLIFGLPVFNWLMPEVAGARVGGFTFTWLFLGVLFYPLTWLLSGYFVRESDNIEAKLVEEYKATQR